MKEERRRAPPFCLFDCGSTRAVFTTQARIARAIRFLTFNCCFHDLCFFMLLINVRHKAIARWRRKPYAIQGKIYIIFGLQLIEIFSFVCSDLFKM